MCSRAAGAAFPWGIVLMTGWKSPDTPQGEGLRFWTYGAGPVKAQVAGETDGAPAGVPVLAGAVTDAAGAGGAHAGTP